MASCKYSGVILFCLLDITHRSGDNCGNSRKNVAKIRIPARKERVLNCERKNLACPAGVRAPRVAPLRLRHRDKSGGGGTGAVRLRRPRAPAVCPQRGGPAERHGGKGRDPVLRGGSGE
ncbi:hypothetical protein SDC9_194910 [bioreactor metagenome]|uniref:Uncharacterized protein n=1 Tax=bioreactor metagenome TaxID=1076179 RepID=A0A645I7S2_9ZZZZ